MFKAIRGYEGIYEVDELGEIRSVDRVIECKDGSVRKRKGRELKPWTRKDGYATVNLTKNGVCKSMRVHRLVAEAFLPNPENLPQIHHKNHVRNDNRAKNLAWVTKSEQRDDHWTKSQSKAQGTRLRVVGHGIDKTFNSAGEAGRELGISPRYVSQVVNGKRKKAKGYEIFFC